MKTNHILLTAALLLSAASCTKEATEIPGTSDDNTLYPVTFSGGIDLVQTKGEDNNTTLMRKDVKAKVWVCASDVDLSSSFTSLASQEYTVGENGDLSIGGSDTIYLVKGNYDFYAVSADSVGTSCPTFSSNESEVLKNGFDYLWVKVDDKAIEGKASKQNVELKFERKAVNIVINIESGTSNGITLTGWDSSGDSAKILPPNPDSKCKMKLSDGSITPATTVLTAGNEAKMTCGEVESNKATVSYIMLPLIGQSEDKPVPTVTLRVKVKNTGESEGVVRTYTTPLNYPSGGFESGKQYTYTATLKANGITFTGATVTNWNPVTFENGEGDLTPTEPDNN